MLTTITTATTTAAAAAAAAISQAAVFGAIGVVILIALLIAKELLSASENEKAQLLGRVTSVAINPLLFAFAFLITITITGADVTELNINPEVVVEGKVISIYGKASPNETLWITSSFDIPLPVSDGKYSVEFIDILFPPGEKEFSVTAENVEDVRVSLCYLFLFLEVEYPLDGPLEATSGIATIAISVPFPLSDIVPSWGGTASISGEKDVKVYGDAAEDAEFVNLSVDMSIKVIADTNGDFKLEVNTGGVPLGEFVITAGELEKTVKIVSTKPVFDTGLSEYPYPSMCGIHNGTFTPNQTITVSQLYTYPCPGTCGHTERVTIWNDRGVIVEANWTGYDGDWRNITFDAITLVAGETYNYSICTGSYPQIIHEHTANVTGVTITCSQFTDANGKVYIDWIPAIILK